MLIDFIIPCLNSAVNTVYCVDSIDYYAGHGDVSINRIIFVNDGSTDWNLEYINGKKFQYLSEKMHRLYKTVINHPRPIGFSKCVNEALEMSNAEFVCILHNDTQFKTKDFLQNITTKLRMLKENEILVPYIEGLTLSDSQKYPGYFPDKDVIINNAPPICWIARKSLFIKHKFNEEFQLSTTAGIEFTKRVKELKFILAPMILFHDGGKGTTQRDPGLPELELLKLEGMLK